MWGGVLFFLNPHNRSEFVMNNAGRFCFSPSLSVFFVSFLYPSYFLGTRYACPLPPLTILPLFFGFFSTAFFFIVHIVHIQQHVEGGELRHFFHIQDIHVYIHHAAQLNASSAYTTSSLHDPIAARCIFSVANAVWPPSSNSTISQSLILSAFPSPPRFFVSSFFVFTGYFFVFPTWQAVHTPILQRNTC